MKKLFTLLFICFNFAGFSQQVYQSQSTYLRGWERYPTKELMEKHIQSKLKIYQFKKGETVASIGSGCGDLEIAYTFYTDSLYFFLQDIEPKYLNPKEVNYCLTKSKQILGGNTKSAFKIVIGSDSETKLPDNFFDKIIIENSFHELDNQNALLKDIYKKLKPDGLLFIEDRLGQAMGQLHPGCNKPMYPEDQLIRVVHDTGFLYLNTQHSTRYPVLSFRKD